MDTASVTSLQESESGPLHYAEQDGRMISPCGQVLVPVNLSPRLAKERGLLTSGTYGRPSTTSFPITSLQSCLESRLRARTRTLGSTLYKLTWKRWVTPSGVSRSRLRASVLRTSETEHTGWPTPNAVETGESLETVLARKQRHKDEGRKIPGLMKLGTAVQLASWPTPCSQDGPHGGPSQGTDRLPAAAALSGWPTTTTRDWKDTGNLDNSSVRKDGKLRNDTLGRITHLAGWPTPMAGTPAQNGYNEAGNTDSSRKTVALASWPTPTSRDHKDAASTLENTPVNALLGRQALGTILSGSPAPTEKRGQLNPAFSRWLMGFPAEWDDCAPTATRSSLRPRPNS